MIFNLKELYQLVGEKRKIQYQIELEQLSDYKGIAFSTPITVDGEFMNRAGIVSLNYISDFSLTPNCDRCLCEFTRDYHYSFEHIIVKSLNTENDDYIVSDGDNLDVDELVISDLLLQLPSKMLCKEECKGLCSSCGADLNVSECGCNNKA